MLAEFLYLSSRKLSRDTDYQIRLLRMAAKAFTNSALAGPLVTSTTGIPSFNTLPQELRGKIYAKLLTLLYAFSISKSLYSGGLLRCEPMPKRTRWLALLLTSNKMTQETLKMFYPRRCFDLRLDPTEQFDILRSFLERIGPVSIASISHLRINFPVEDRSGEKRTGLDSLQSLQLLCEKYIGLSELENVSYSDTLSIFIERKSGEEKDGRRKNRQRKDERKDVLETLNAYIKGNKEKLTVTVIIKAHEKDTEEEIIQRPEWRPMVARGWANKSVQ